MFVVKRKLWILLIALTMSTVLHACILPKNFYQTITLFNGRDLSGWQQIGKGRFSVEKGLLKTHSGMGLLWFTKQKFGNAIIRVVYKATYADANSGIYVRIADAPKSAWDAVHRGYEIQICDTGQEAFDAYHRTGAIYSFAKATEQVAKKAGEWNILEIILRGDEITTRLNGILVSQFDPARDHPPKRQKYSDPKRGPRPVYSYVGIQNHDHTARAPDSHVYFKEISVLPLTEG